MAASLSPKPQKVFRRARYSIGGLVISISQITAARICRLYLRIFGNISLKTTVNFNPRTRYLFVANHQSELDPFAVFGSLPFVDNLRIAPVRFLTAKTVYYTPILPWLKSMGCYPTRGSRTRIISQSKQMLRKGYCVFIFPEGKRTTRATSEPRPGVSDLIKQATAEFDVTMILVHIEWQNQSFLKRSVAIHLSEAPGDLHQKDAPTIMNTLYELS